MSNDRLSLKERLAQKIANQEVTVPKNPYWHMKDGYIMNTRTEIPFNIPSVEPILKVVTQYFRHIYDALQSEAQVLVLTDEDAKKIDLYGMPVIPSLASPFLHIVVLPQDNSWGGTTVSEAWWQRNIASKGISPFMRIHSHHTMEAYQSHTDWSTLNSNTLEIVIGRIQHETPSFGYWLDVLGTDNKEIVYYTEDYGKNVKLIDSGKKKRPHPDVPTPVEYGQYGSMNE